MAETEDYSMSCPICSVGKLKMTSMLYSVPYFNELAMFTMKCTSCDFKHNDIFSSEQRRPTRFSMFVDDASLLRVRVVRSGSGTVRFPEFGIDVEPGPASESYVSNIEGVLYRTRSVVETAVNFAETTAQKEQGKKVLDMMKQALEGEYSFTIILEDPAGTSGILPDDMRLVKIEELSREEAVRLKGAPMWLDDVREEYRERKG